MVETEARQIALSHTVIQSRLNQKRELIFNRRMCVFTSECGIFRRVISLTEAALFVSTFRYPLKLHCQPSLLCACKFNLPLFQTSECHGSNRIKGAIIMLL